jgi:hypothetical protein
MKDIPVWGQVRMGPNIKSTSAVHELEASPDPFAYSCVTRREAGVYLGPYRTCPAVLLRVRLLS